MSITRLAGVLVATLTLATSTTLLAQNIPAQSVRPNSVLTAGSGADETKAPKLERFDPELVDKTLDPCNDFYKYACNKWLTANPIPADQVVWATGSGLQLWNENLLRETLVAASADDGKRTAVHQKIGDYWAACMDESAIEAAGIKPLQPELARIAALKSKKEITAEIARLQHMYPGAWAPGDNQS